MTTVIALERDSKVDLGWDRQVTHGVRRIPGDDKVFVNGGIIFGCSGDVLDSNILRYATLPDPGQSGWDVDRWVTRELIPAIRTALNTAEATTKRDSKVQTGNFALIVVTNRIYMLSSDLSWYRNTDGIYGVGSGSDFAIGAILAGATIDEALTIATKLDVYTGNDHQVATAAELLETLA
jgi:ATP-dependent protease HslVU (ClpYQ) peptidase subunit